MENQRKERTVYELAAENNALRAENETLNAENKTLNAEIETLNAENERLQQQVDMLRKAVFGPRSEKKVLQNTENPEQLSLFNEAETEARREESEEVTVPAHKRRACRRSTLYSGG